MSAASEAGEGQIWKIGNLLGELPRQFLKDHGQDTLTICEDIRIPKPYDTVSLLGDISISHGIACAFRVLAAIKLDDQL